MRTTLAALGLALLANCCAYAQTKVSQPAGGEAVARCELSNGTKMILDYSGATTSPKQSDALGAQMDFFTSGNVVSVHGIYLSFGIYKVHTVHDLDKWTLTMKQVADDGITPRKSGAEEPIRLPMSLAKVPSSSKTLAISFDRTGEACTLHMDWQNTQASVEFAARDKDLSTR
jgi:hypothetical protein